MIITVSGKLGTGKDEFAKIAIEEFGAKRFAFADALKQEVCNFLDYIRVPYTNSNIYGSQADKEKTFSIVNVDNTIIAVPAFEDFVNKFAQKDPYFHNNITATYRSLLQWWGTEFRRAQDDNYWVNRAVEKIVLEPNTLWVGTDGRFPNEMDTMKKAGSALVRLVRDNAFVSATSQHASEIALDDYLWFDYMIMNNNTLDKFHDKCRVVIKDILGRKNEYSN